MGFPMVYDMIIFNNEYPFLVTLELRTNFWAGFEVGEGGQIFLKRSLALSNSSICLTSLAKKVEQTDGRLKIFTILAQLKLRTPRKTHEEFTFGKVASIQLPILQMLYSIINVSLRTFQNFWNTYFQEDFYCGASVLMIWWVKTCWNAAQWHFSTL